MVVRAAGCQLVSDAFVFQSAVLGWAGQFGRAACLVLRQRRVADGYLRQSGSACWQPCLLGSRSLFLEVLQYVQLVTSA